VLNLVRLERQIDVGYTSVRRRHKDASKKEDGWKEVAEEVGEGATGLYCHGIANLPTHTRVDMWSAIRNLFVDCHIGLFAMHTVMYFP